MIIKELQNLFTKPGRVVYLSIRKKRLEPVTALNEVLAIEGKGLEGDRYQNLGGARQVTLIQAEHLASVSSFVGKNISPDLTRRNIIVKGINLLAFKGKNFKIGQAILQYSGECHPCSRMEENLGPGGYNALRGHGGITAKVIEAGLIKLDDEVIAID